MLKTLAIATAIGVVLGGSAMAETMRKPILADDPVAPLLIDHKEKHKNKDWKHFGQRRGEDEDEDERGGRRFSNRASPGCGDPFRAYSGSSRPYYEAPRGYRYYGPPRYYDYGPTPYYRGGY